MDNSLDIVNRFLSGWKPFADLPADRVLREQILSFLAAEDMEERRHIFASASDLYRLHERYREMEIFRAGKNEKAEQFERLFGLSMAEFAAAIEAKSPKEYLGLLQSCFEFGRSAVEPRHNLMREFIDHLFRLEFHAPPIRYSFYPGGVIYSVSGKSHDEMARDFVKLGLGGGAPITGGMMTRTGTLEFLYDVNSTAFRGTGDPGVVREGLLKWIRLTGGDAEKVKIVLDTTRFDA